MQAFINALAALLTNERAKLIKFEDIKKQYS
jgi:hypothetical protein